jgi:drug/metabolite transporter (DMT)-like permease
MLAAIGGLGAIGQILMIRAFEFATTSVLAPLFYLHLIWALIYGLALFGDVPSPVTLFGAVLIIASGYYVYRAG